MGKLVQVKASSGGVPLPPLGVHYYAGETATLTDKEYGALTTTAKNAIVVVTSGLPDPVRSKSSTTPSSAADAYRLSKQYTDESVKGAVTLINQSNKFSYRIVAKNNAYASRPAGVPAGQVVYVGPIQPTDWQIGDAWDDTSS
jgi:hypothetical protein